METKLALRAFIEDDLAYLDRWGADPDAVGPFEWFGFRDPRRRRRRWEKDGYISDDLTSLAVTLADGTVTGVVSYWPKGHGGPAGGCFETGIALLPEYRGRGLGAVAQQLLLAHLFDFTLANRIEALTDDENIAAQRILERAGMQREGVLRGSYFHLGSWRSLVVYGALRGDRSGSSSGALHQPRPIGEGNQLGAVLEV